MRHPIVKVLGELRTGDSNGTIYELLARQDARDVPWSIFVLVRDEDGEAQLIARSEVHTGPSGQRAENAPRTAHVMSVIVDHESARRSFCVTSRHKLLLHALLLFVPFYCNYKKLPLLSLKLTK